MGNSWTLIILALSVTILPLLLIIFLADKFSGPSLKTVSFKINKLSSESEENISMSQMSPKIKTRLIILAVCTVAFLFFGFKGNGEVYYYGNNYEVGSVFLPESYTSYGLFSDAADELNGLVSQKRNSSFMGVLVSLAVAGVVGYSLSKEDEFKKLVMEWEKAK